MIERLEQHRRLGAALTHLGEVEVPAHYGDAGAEYQHITRGAGVHDRCYRGLIEVRGKDRAPWLHNLFTNDVKRLGAGQGCYGFALNVKGRVQFDANVLAAAGELLVDVDRRWIPAALAHFGKYVVMEDVQFEDASDRTGRVAVVGPRAAELLERWPGAGLAALPALAHVIASIAGVEVRLVRHDFAGALGAELIVPAAAVSRVWGAVVEAAGGIGGGAAGLDAVQMARIEAGLPWPLQDLDDQVLPAETGQLERAVSFSKGCYLGQEVVERMRAHRSLARQLVGLLFASSCAPAGALLQHAGSAVGRVTSVADSTRLGRRIGLGYVKTALAAGGTELVAAGSGASTCCTVTALPFIRSS